MRPTSREKTEKRGCERKKEIRREGKEGKNRKELVLILLLSELIPGGGGESERRRGGGKSRTARLHSFLSSVFLSLFRKNQEGEESMATRHQDVVSHQQKGKSTGRTPIYDSFFDGFLEIVTIRDRFYSSWFLLSF